VGVDAYLKISANSTVDLYRNNSGASYPYNVGTFLSITKNSSNAGNAYFYFYDWEVAATPCISPAKKVTAYVGGTPPTAAFNYNQSLSTISFFNTSVNDNAAIWEFGDGATSTTLQPSHTYSAVGTYNVLLRALNGGCVDSTTQTVTITALSGISTADFTQNLQLFPNPGSESFTLAFSLEKTEQVQIEMHNVLGQTVLISSPYMTNAFEQTFSLANLANGMYEIAIRAGDKVMYKKYFVGK
jgi:PKD repeat protein